MSSKATKARKHREEQLLALTVPQLIALVVQREIMPYVIAQGQTKNHLVESLVEIEDVLKPVPA